MKDKEMKEFEANLWRYENVGAIIYGKLVCLDCLTENEKGKATEDVTLDCKELYVDSPELDQGPTSCARCGKELISNEKRQEMWERERKGKNERPKPKRSDNA